MLHQGLTSKEKDCYPYWNESKKEISEKLWLPIRTDCADSDLTYLNTLSKEQEEKSFAVKKIKKRLQNKNYVKTSSQSLLSFPVKYMDSESTKRKSKSKLENKNLKTITFLLKVKKKKKKEIQEQFSLFRWSYNMVISLSSKKRFKGVVNFTALRDLVRHYKYEEKYEPKQNPKNYIYVEDRKEFPIPTWMKGKAYDRVIRGAIKNYSQNLKSALSNKKNGNITKFKLRPRTKKD
jgi:hypothetical protein